MKVIKHRKGGFTLKCSDEETMLIAHLFGGMTGSALNGYPMSENANYLNYKQLVGVLPDYHKFPYLHVKGK